MAHQYRVVSTYYIVGECEVCNGQRDVLEVEMRILDECGMEDFV